MLTKLFCKAQARLIEFKNDERGVTAIEYGLIGVAMAAALTVVFTGDSNGGLVDQLKSAFSAITTDLSSAASQSK